MAAAPALPGTAAQVISGAYQLWHTPLHPFLQQLPAWFVLRADELPRLGPLSLALGLLADELGQDAPGARAVVHGLMDVVFSYLLRELLRRQAPGTASWAQALRDAAEVFEYPMIDRDPVPTWVDGRVALLGDAAHVMYPVGSNGASQAIVDARVLGAELVRHGVGPAALQAGLRRALPYLLGTLAVGGWLATRLARVSRRAV